MWGMYVTLTLWKSCCCNCRYGTFGFDNEYIYEAELEKTADNEITGMRRGRGWTDNQYIYFVARFSKSFQTVVEFVKKKKVPINTKLTGTDLQAIPTFDNTNGEPIIAKVGLSLVECAERVKTWRLK